MRLHLGCGAELREGFVNVDLREDVGADVVGPADSLPWVADGEASQLVALDLLEHFPRDVFPSVLAEWRRVLRPGGELVVRVPNLQALGRQLAQGRSLELTIENIYGGHRWGPGGSWDTHHHGWVPATLKRDLEEAGFTVVNNDGRANMTVRAVRNP